MQNSDTEHLGAAWEELRAELSRLVWAMGIGSANADDILQEVYLAAREKCPPALPVEGGIVTIRRIKWTSPPK